MEYQKHEFCKDIKCNQFIPESKKHGITESCMFSHDSDCIHTAKEFHKWLKENNFKLVKEEFRAGEKEQLCSCGWKGSRY